MDLVTELTIFVLAAFVGFEVISKVPSTLHTPLMSQTNAIHGIVMLGGLIVAGYAEGGLELTIGFIAIAFGTINIVGGFMVTDRMLGMFSRRKPPKAGDSRARTRRAESMTATDPADRSFRAGWRRRHASLHRRLLDVHHRNQAGHPPDHRQARQHDRRRRHADRGRHDAAAGRDRQLGDHLRAACSSAARLA